ncbi:MAG TPA: DNA internalization-related competence protein ComEC/Rec2 [Usitatibacteraceae bacterium]
MRSLTLGLLIGAFLLQGMASLPLDGSGWWLTAGAALAALVALAYIGLARIAARRAQQGIAAKCAGVVTILLAGSLLGFSYAHWRADLRLADELPREWEGRDVQVVGIVASLPTLNERGTRFEFDIEKTLTPEATLPPHISITWYVELAHQGKSGKEDEATKPPLEIKPGERWQLTLRLRRPHGTQNPHGYDFEAWALERNIRATGYVRSKGVNQLLGGHAGGIGTHIDRLRLSIRERMNAVLKDKPYGGVLVALAIGEQNAIPAEQWRVFWRTGVGHLMSISGLHITMVASLLYWLAFRIWARIPALALRLPAQRAAVLAGAVAALSYSLVAGFSVPTQRTLFMLSAVAVALWMGRATSPSRVLSWALCAVLLLDPWAVLTPGFWLSFGAVAAIFYVTAHRTGEMSSLKGAVLTQLAVTLGLLPMTLALFQEVSVVSPIANAFAIPLISLVVVPITLLGAVLPFDWLLLLAHELMSWCYLALQWLAATPNAVWQSHAPPLWTVALALIGCAWLLLPRGLSTRSFGFVFVLPMFLVLPPAPQAGELWVTLLDVGQGLATVVRTEHHTLVYDTGPSYNPDSDSGNRIVVPYLRGEGIRELDALIVTHDDDDHSGGARSIIAARNPKWVLTSLEKDRDILAGANEVLRCDDRDDWQWDGVNFDIIHPVKDNYSEGNRKINDLGCVLKIAAPGGSILFTADVEKKGEIEMMERASADLKADVMVVPHHGSKTSSTEAFLDAVQPKVALIPVGYRNRFRHPNKEVMARYVERGITTYRTDEMGALTLKFSVDAKGKPVVTAYRNERRRYWLDLPAKEEGALD